MGSSSEPVQLIIHVCVAFVVAVVASMVSAWLEAIGEHRLEALIDHKEGLPLGTARLGERSEGVKLSLQILDLAATLALGVGGALLLSQTFRALLSAILVGCGAGLVFLIARTAARALISRDPERQLPWMAPIAAGIDLLLSPLSGPLSSMAKLIRGPGALTQEEATEELEYLIEKRSEAGSFDAEQRDLLESVIEFTQVRVREIMVPRPKVVALPLDASHDEVVRAIVESGYSRLPVYDSSVDQIAGMLYAKRLLEEMNRSNGEGQNGFRLANHIAPPFFVPETMRISHLLGEFQRRGLQIAVVVDEFGGTAGLVTLEDVVEEIVGEIRDESDRVEQQPIRVLGGEILQAEGSVSIRDLEDFVEESLPEWELEFPEEGDYDTVGGFITAMAGYVPKLGQQLEYDGFLFTVRSADQKRVARVEITSAPPEALGEGLPNTPQKHVES